MRFAHSERDYLVSLRATVASQARDFITLARFGMCEYDLPLGGLSYPPILQNVLDTVDLQGQFSAVRASCLRDPRRSWIADYPVVDFPASFASF